MLLSIHVPKKRFISLDNETQEDIQSNSDVVRWAQLSCYSRSFNLEIQKNNWLTQAFSKAKGTFSGPFQCSGISLSSTCWFFLKGTELCWNFGRLFSFEQRHHPPKMTEYQKIQLSKQLLEKLILLLFWLPSLQKMDQQAPLHCLIRHWILIWTCSFSKVAVSAWSTQSLASLLPLKL